MHVWRSQGTVKVLLGNLEGAYCGGTEGGEYEYSDGCSIPIKPTGGYAGIPLFASPATHVLGEHSQLVFELID